MNPSSKLPVMMGALIALGGCNMVMTDKPMFTAADGAGAPPIRSGVWRDDKPDCVFDETAPQNKWPKCAGAEPGVADLPYWLEVAGEPDLLQTPLPRQDKKPGVEYLYAAFRPLKLDTKGRIIAMKRWPVLCGPPPPPVAAPPPSRSDQVGDKAAAAAWADLGANLDRLGPTKSPLPGLTMAPDGETCTPDSAAAFRSAAKASEAWTEEPATSHWVRDHRSGDLPVLTPALVEKAMKTPR